MTRCVSMAFSRCPHGTQYSISTLGPMFSSAQLSPTTIYLEVRVARDGLEVGVVVQEFGALANHGDRDHQIGHLPDRLAARTASAIEVAFPADTLQSEDLLFRQTPQRFAERVVDGFALRLEAVPLHDAPDHVVIDIDVRPAHEHHRTPPCV